MMSLIKCKMCGGSLQLQPGATTAECEYCGALQTVPQADDERKLVLFERAERLRRQCEFDKAAGLYESIVTDFRQEAEAYWGIVLCKYGIEYVDDPATGKKIPTCHRSSFRSIMTDPDFEQVLENADISARRIYREEAKQIEELRKGIVAVSSQEAPYDIFICYKETDETGQRTLDSVLAQDIYQALVREGYRVFFSRISLEDKLGQKYEPYIFAALNSAKIMLAIGTDYEYFNAVWVKNEWGRFLKLMAEDHTRHLIPCFKGIDAYDMPQEFSKLQAQDLGKVGAVQDLLYGIRKLMGDKPENRQEPIPQQAVFSAAPLLKRTVLFLEDRDFARADQLCEQILNQDPENGEAYLYKLMISLSVSQRTQLKELPTPFDDHIHYQKILRFGNEALKNELSGYIEAIRQRNIRNYRESIYREGLAAMQEADKLYTRDAYQKAAERFDKLPDYQDAAQLAQTCRERAEKARKDHIYTQAMQYRDIKDFVTCEACCRLFATIPGWRDADEQLHQCQEKIKKLKAEQSERIAAEQERRRKTDRVVKILAAVCGALLVVILLYLFITTGLIPTVKYNNAMNMMSNGQYQEAATVFDSLGDFSDSREKSQKCYYELAESLADSDPALAAIAYGKAGNYMNAQAKSQSVWNGITQRDSLSAGAWHSVGLKKDGTVLSIGSYGEGECLTGSWNNIIAVEAGNFSTVGLKSDGTVLATGSDEYGQCHVEEWSQIVAISAGRYHTVGLRSNGTVVATGNNEYGQCDVGTWTDIIAVSAGANHTVGLKADGTVVAVGYAGDGRCDVNRWTNIIAISAGGSHTVGLTADGSVLAVGDSKDGKLDVAGWKNIKAISAGTDHTVGLKQDGTVVAVGMNDCSQCDVLRWNNVIAISAGQVHTLALTSEGSVLVVGDEKVSGFDTLHNWVLNTN